MKSHSHIIICDEDWMPYYDLINFNQAESVEQFSNFIFSMFKLLSSKRITLEDKMYKRIDLQSDNPIYFKSGDFIYLWVLCHKCQLIGLN